MRYTITTITPEEIKEQHRKRIAEVGLYESVVEELDEIVDMARMMRQMQFNVVMDHLQTILELIQTYTEGQDA